MFIKKDLLMRLSMAENDIDWIYDEIDNLKEKIKELGKEKKTVKRVKKNEVKK